MRGKAHATVVLEQAILDIVEERHPITVRGVCYALFVSKLIPSMEVKHTQRISRVMTAMREHDDLDWTMVVDGSRTIARAGTWSDPSTIIDAAVASYRRDNWQDQPVQVEVWSEKSTVHGVLMPTLHDYGVTFRPIKGFGSYTVVRGAIEEANDLVDATAKPTVALYVGDWDPSGMHMSEIDLPNRIERYGGEVEVRRIALVEHDIRDLPSFAAKRSDPRFRWFTQTYGRRCWELDAMNPNNLRDRVESEISRYIDWPLWQRALEVEAAEVESMHDFHTAWRNQLDRKSP